MLVSNKALANVFLSKLPHVRHPSITKKSPSQAAYTTTSPSPSSSDLSRPPSINASVPPPTYTADPSSDKSPSCPDQPSNTGTHAFTISLYARPYTITLHHNTTSLLSPSSDTHLSTVGPSLAVFTYAIPSRPSLHNVLHYWSKKLRQLYPSFDGPVLLLGLQRDLRTDKQVPSLNSTSNIDSANGEGVHHNQSALSSTTQQYESVMPQEGLEAARLLHADRYAECSALTGELIGEVLQDLTRMAAKTTVDGSGREQGWGCFVM